MKNLTLNMKYDEKRIKQSTIIFKLNELLQEMISSWSWEVIRE